MSLYIYSNPFENSLFNVFDNEVFNNNDIDNDDFFDSLIPYSYSTFTHPCRSSISRRIRHNNRWSPYKKFEKQLKKYFKEDHQKLVDFTPKINLTEDENNYYIHADLPGMAKDQVNMELNQGDRILTISGERKSIYNNNDDDENQKEEKEEKVHENNKEEKKETEKNNSNIKTKESTEDENKLIKHNKKVNEIQKKNNYHFSVMECSYGTFSKSFHLPEDADINRIHAKMENGVLEVTINKIEEEPKNKNRSIQIQ